MKVPLRINARRIVEEAIERGLERGMERAHKHGDAPSKGHILEQQTHAIWLELDEYLDFGEEQP
jgi:hypothetical protein